MGSLRLAVYLGTVVDHPRRFGPSHLERCCGLLGFVCDLSNSHDLVDRNPRIKTVEALDENAADSALGRLGVSNLAGKFHAIIDPLAWRGLPTPKRPIRCGCDHSCAGFRLQERFVENTHHLNFTLLLRRQPPDADYFWPALTATSVAMFARSRRSLRGSRQFTCGRMIVGSIRSRYLRAIFISESKRDSER